MDISPPFNSPLFATFYTLSIIDYIHVYSRCHPPTHATHATHTTHATHPTYSTHATHATHQLTLLTSTYRTYIICIHVCVCVCVCVFVCRYRPRPSPPPPSPPPPPPSLTQQPLSTNWRVHRLRGKQRQYRAPLPERETLEGGRAGGRERGWGGAGRSSTQRQPCCIALWCGPVQILTKT